MQNLISVLAKSGGEGAFVRKIGQEIQNLDKECALLEQERTNLRVEGECIQGSGQQAELLLPQISSFCNLFNALTVPEQREYLRIVLDKVVWDGEAAHMFINGCP